MGEELVLKKLDGSVGYAVLNRPPVNALSGALLGAIENVLQEWEKMESVRCVVITGPGSKFFCAGADVKEIKDALTSGAASDLVERGHRIFAKIESYPKPVIAGINGLALGGGLELAMACHLRVASETARLGLPEILLGIIPGFGGTQRLPRLIPPGIALEWILSGKQVPAAEAAQLGLLNAVFPADGLEKGLADLAAGLASKPPIAVREALQAVTVGRFLPLREGLQVEKQGFCVLAKTEDALEGLNAMLEKRAPAFKGL